MAYQFIHVETYAEAAAPVKGSTIHFNSAAQVLGEARRDPLHSRHVPHPQRPRPVVLDGVMGLDDFITLRAEKLAAIAETVTAKNGSTYSRRLRKDAATLYTEIHSHPLTVAEFLADPDATRPVIRAWQSRIVEDFRRRMPPGVAFTAVVHLDEEHVHMHILAINIGDPKLDANKLHAGKVAAATFRERNESDAIASLPLPDLLPRPKKPKKSKPSKNRETQTKNVAKDTAAVANWEVDCRFVEATNSDRLTEWEARNKLHLKAARRVRGKPKVQDAYTEAMRSLQDDYYEAVGKPCGLLRIGPRLDRKSTKEYAEAKRQAERLSQDLAKIAQDKALNIAQEQQLTRNATLIADIGNEVKRDRELQAEEAKRLAALERRLAEQGKDIVAREAQLAERTKAVSGREAALVDQEAALSTRETDFRRDYGNAELRISARVSDLQGREEALELSGGKLKAERREFDSMVEAMDATVTAVENEETVIADGRIRFRNLPDAIRSFYNTTATGGTTKMRQLFNRFLGIVMRAANSESIEATDNEYNGPS